MRPRVDPGGATIAGTSGASASAHSPSVHELRGSFMSSAARGEMRSRRFSTTFLASVTSTSGHGWPCRTIGA